MKKQHKKAVHRSLFAFMAEVLILALLLVTASYAPQMIFQIQDNILCDKTSIGQRENMDVESLSITYEKSLLQRMQVFAEGLKSGVKYYITSQNLTVTEEIYEYLYSARGLQQGIIQMLAESEFIPMSFYGDIYVNEWKQYVIYSDNYAEGVNFILWYIEIQNMENTILKLLMDAETGTFYALKTEPVEDVEKVLMWGEIDDLWTIDYLNFLMMWWNRYADYYEVFLQNNAAIFLDEMEMAATLKIKEKINMNEENMRNEAAYGGAISIVENGVEYGSITDILEIIARDNVGFRWNGNGIDFYLPYGEALLTVTILLDVESTLDQKLGVRIYYRYSDTTIGIREIYELIPEFI